MELSLFLAKLFGIYMLAVSLLWLVRREAMSQAMEEFFTASQSPAVAGTASLRSLSPAYARLSRMRSIAINVSPIAE